MNPIIPITIRAIIGDRIALDQLLATPWDTTLPLLDEHGLSSLVYPLIKADATVPDDAKTVLRRSHENTLIHYDLAAATLRELAPSLLRTGRVVLLKGMALMESVYANGNARTMSDVDLFFPDGNLEEAVTALRSQGFEQYRDYKTVLRSGGITLDLHGDLWDSGRVAARAVGSQPLEFTESGVLPGYLVPAPELLATHTARHAVKHGFSRGLWLADCALLFKNGKFDRSSDNAVAASLDMLEALGIISGSERHTRGWRFRRAVKLLQQGSESHGETALALLMPTAAGTISYLMQSAFPPPAVLREMYGNHGVVVLLFKRLFVLVTRIFRVNR